MTSPSVLRSVRFPAELIARLLNEAKASGATFNAYVVGRLNVGLEASAKSGEAQGREEAQQSPPPDAGRMGKTGIARKRNRPNGGRGKSGEGLGSMGSERAMDGAECGARSSSPLPPTSDQKPPPRKRPSEDIIKSMPAWQRRTFGYE